MGRTDSPQAEQDRHIDEFTDLCRVHDGGAIVIDGDARHVYDIREGDILDLRIATEDGTAFWLTDAVVKRAGSVRIPKHKRDLYGVEDDQYVEVTGYTTGLSVE